MEFWGWGGIVSDEASPAKKGACQNGFCLREAEPGRQFCAKHADADPNQFPVMGCLIALVIAGLIGWGVFTFFRGEGSQGAAGGSGVGLDDAEVADVTQYAGLSADADRYLARNFAGDPAYVVVQSVQVKSGVLWMYTSVPPGDVRSATAVCGLGSAWVYSDPEAISAQVWGVSVRASGGQRLVQRDGFGDACS